MSRPMCPVPTMREIADKIDRVTELAKQAQQRIAALEAENAKMREDLRAAGESIGRTDDPTPVLFAALIRNLRHQVGIERHWQNRTVKERDEALARIAALEEALRLARGHVEALVMPEASWHKDSGPRWAYCTLDAKDFKDHQAAAAWLQFGFRPNATRLQTLLDIQCLPKA